MNREANNIFSKVNDISEWQKLCSSYSFHDQEEYKLEWWQKVIEDTCHKKKSVIIDINSLKSIVQEEFRQWPIEILCLKNVFKGLVMKKKIANLGFISKFVTQTWECALKDERKRSQANQSVIGFGWINSVIGILLKKGTYIAETDEQSYETDSYVCVTLIEKLVNRVVDDINKGLLGNISKSISTDEMLLLYSKFINYIFNVTDGLYSIPRAALEEIVLWYFISFLPGEWTLKPFVVCSRTDTYINAIKLIRTYSSRKKIEISETDVAEIILQIAEEDIQKSIISLEEKFLFHDSKCKEYVLNDQKQLAINHLKQKRQIEKALNEINEQLLILSQSRVTFDTSTARISLLTAIETTSNATKYIMNEAELLRRLDDISRIQEEVEVVQDSIDSVIKSSAIGISTCGERSTDELERELDEILNKANTDNSNRDIADKIPGDTNKRNECNIGEMIGAS
ncbi:Snf7 family protein [Cryptosporidium felis]|nr:Snf7 family protein [Cryptosporidium felis]